MLPTLAEVGGVVVPTYLVTTFLGYGVGFGWLHRSASRLLTDGDRLVGLYVSLAVSGWLGARLMHIMGGLGTLRPSEVLAAVGRPGGGVAFLGGVFGGTVGAVLYMIWRRLPVWKLLDVAAAPLMAGLAIGRVGCTLAGCCHGRTVDGAIRSVWLSMPGGNLVAVDGWPWLALVYAPIGHGSLFDVPIFPTQPMEVVLAGALALLLHRGYRSRRFFDGQVFAVMLLGYGLARLGVEQLRGDVIRGTAHALLGTHFSTGELSGMVLIALSAAITVLRWRTPLGPEPVDMGALDDEEEPVSDLPEL